MSDDEQEIEAEIQAKGLNAPRLNPEKLDEVIVSEQYHHFPGTTVTVCCLTLRNGYAVVGHSAAASPGNFDVEIGKKIARVNARNNIWALEGYLLREKIHSQAKLESYLLPLEQIASAVAGDTTREVEDSWDD